MTDTLYILTRTSGRAEFFRRCRESVKALTWPGDVVHLVHTDDPRDKYVEGDIIIRGELHGRNMGTAPYNLYNNRLIEAIPGDGWVHIIDDDDEYAAPDVFERLLDGAKRDHVQVGHVDRGGGRIWPKYWGEQKSYQSECFCVWTKLARQGKWWSDKAGDHYYSKQLTKLAAGTQWHDDVLIAQAQDGKNHGKTFDTYEPMKANKKVWIKMHVNRLRMIGGKLYQMEYKEAEKWESKGYGKITYKGVEVVVCTP